VPTVDRNALTNAWKGRISGCQLGKAVEIMSMVGGHDTLTSYLSEVEAVPLRDYIPYTEGRSLFQGSCRGEITRSEVDDDINYSVLALMLLERHGRDLQTVDVGRAWLELLPLGAVFTAERVAYRVLADHTSPFTQGLEPGFDIAECSDNEYNDWIGGQIRADVYGWVLPGDPTEAARLAGIDAELSHRGAGVHGAQFVAACSAAIPVADSLDEAVGRATAELPAGSEAVAAIEVGRSVVGRDDAVEVLHDTYGHLSPVHSLNNLALVVWALLSHEDDFGAAVGEAVAAGWDTDCNAATVGGLWGISGREVPPSWTEPWMPRVAVGLAGHSELTLDDLVDRTAAVADHLA
jgi:ADP-ribosylglycohydrolase